MSRSEAWAASVRRARQGAALVLFASCTAAADRPAPPGQPQTWSLSFRVSGGFAGSNRSLDLSSAGGLVAIDARRHVRREARAPAPDLAEIAAALDAVSSVSSRRTAECRDCLEYELTIRKADRSVVVRLQDATLDGSGAEALVRRLTKLLDLTLADKLNPQRSE